MDNIAIRFHHVSKYFKKLKVLDDINFEIKEGERVLIFGPNGIGKTTILKIIAGILVPDKGSVEAKGTIGYVFQEPRLLPWKTALENVNLVLQNREKAIEWLKKVGLKDFENYYPNNLSGGMKQKVALARALAIEPEILLLDEPFSNLDFRAKNEVLSLLKRILSKNKATIVYVTHDTKEVSNFINRVLVLPYTKKQSPNLTVLYPSI